MPGFCLDPLPTLPLLCEVLHHASAFLVIPTGSSQIRTPLLPYFLTNVSEELITPNGNPFPSSHLSSFHGQALTLTHGLLAGTCTPCSALPSTLAPSHNPGVPLIPIHSPQHSTWFHSYSPCLREGVVTPPHHLHRLARLPASELPAFGPFPTF